MSKKQATLFQSWGNKAKHTTNTDDTPRQFLPQPSTSTATDNVIDLCGSFEDEDDDMLSKAEESIAHINKTNGSSTKQTIFQTYGSKENTHENNNLEFAAGDISIGADDFTLTQTQAQNSNCQGFDKNAGKLWIYPTNYPVREYQFNIVQEALFKNTMVTLPTGLGKTFIAAVVMYNFYRWYPRGKVIFMAPTKPLVAQQIEACYNIMGIPQDHTAEMTGSMGPSKREKAWHDKRVFFLTPQVLTNDLSRGSCPATDVKCLVIDEAHKALGNHAYCQVVRELVKYTETFRILALSATPGSDIKAVQQVLNNLLISQIEIRTEESADIKKYSHERKVEKVVVPLGEELTKVKTKYIHIMEVVVNRLKRSSVLYNKETTSLSKFLILKAREAFRQNPPEKLPRNQYGIVEGDFALAMSLYHGYELLQLHGSRSLYNFLDGILTGEKGYGRTRTELTKNADFNDLMGILSNKYTKPDGETPSQALAKPFVTGHPKMVKLQEIVLDHFNAHSDSTTRVMIFSQYRDSVQEITDMLNVHRPVVMAMSFIGQATAGKSTKGFTQKEQLKVMKQFREGGYNTLVSTCVGEEGLDIGDVDLIICFDAHKSPIRLVQRMGRTGRKREGRIVMLVTQGKEEQIYNQSQYSKKSIHKVILSGAKSLHFYQHSARMLPDNVTPACHKMHITVKETFKPTKKITTDKDVNQSTLNSMVNNAAASKKSVQSEEVLTLEEYRELEPWLVPESDISKLPVSCIICLDKSGTAQENQESTGRLLSLSEWSPWQNTLQETVRVDHSLASKHLVELMEFIQLQQSLDPDDDPYGLEMAAYLNQEDIIQTGETDPSSVAKFFVQKKTKNQKNLAEKGQKGKGKSKLRRSDNLPSFDFLDDKAVNSSDEELPDINVGINMDKENGDEVDGDCAIKTNKAGQGIDAYSKTKGNSVSEIMDISEVSHSNSEDEENKTDTMSKSEAGPIRKVITSKVKAMEKRMDVAKIRKRKKSRQNSGQTSLIKPIADSDSNDFDVAPNAQFDTVEELADIEKCPEISEKAKTAEMEKGRLNQLEFNYVDLNTSIGFKENSEIGCFRIRSPPPLDRVENLCKALDMETHFDICDLFTAIKEWHTENLFGKYIVYPTHVKIDPFSNCCSNRTSESSLLDQTSSEKVDDNVIPNDSGVFNDQTVDLEADKHILSLNHEAEKEALETLNEHFVTHNESSDASTHSEDNENCNILDIFECQKSKSKEEMQSDVKTTETSLTCKGLENTEQTEQNNGDYISGTGNFMLNADDMFSSDDELDCDEMIEVVKDNNQCSKETYSSDNEFANKNNSEMKSDKYNDLAVIGPADEGKLKHSFINRSPRDNLNSSIESATSEVFSIPFTNVKKSTYDSFLADSKDDDILMDVKTPKINRANETSTQITFTQALNFVHSGSRTPSADSVSEHLSKELIDGKHSSSYSKIDQNEQINVLGSCESDAKEVKTVPSELLQSHDKLENRSASLSTENHNSAIKDDALKPLGRKLSSSTDEEVEIPEFDLGFDFDEDIIPPSPKASQKLQLPTSSRLSQAFAFTSRLSQSKVISEEILSEENHQTSSKKYSTDQITSDKIVSSKITRSKTGSVEQNLSVPSCTENVNGDEESQSILDDNASLARRDKLHTSKRSTLQTVKELPVDENITESETEKERLDKIANTEQCRSVNNVRRSLINENSDNIGDFDSSFALLDEDIDDWINSCVEPQVKEKEDDKVHHVVDKKPERKDLDHNDALSSSQIAPDKFMSRSDAQVAVVSPFNFSQEPTDKTSNMKNKVELRKDKPIRKSMFAIDELSSDSFEELDDLNNFNDKPLLKKTTPKISGIKSLHRHNTSTPMENRNKVMKSVTPVIDITSSVTKDMSKSGLDYTPLKSPYAERFGVAEKQINSHNVTERSLVEKNCSEDDDSFIVRRKKKVQILDSPLTQKDSNSRPVKALPENQPTTIDIDGDDDDFDDTFMLTQQGYVIQKPSIPSFDQSSDEDFEVRKQISFHSDKKQKGEIRVKKVANGSENGKKRNKLNRKRTLNPFIDEEAELSEEGHSDASTDEHEGSDLDVYDDSFIGDSQFTESQMMNQSDVHALYLKSVKSPPARGRFKLQFNPRNDVSVYSQAPPPEDSHYMEDSFCVGSEEEEDSWLLREEGESDDEPKEVTLLQNSVMQTGRKRRRGVQAFQTTRQREIHVGRMKALSEIRSKLAGKTAQTAGQHSKHLSNTKAPPAGKSGKRNRIQIETDSSSEEDNKFQMNRSDLLSQNVRDTANRNKRPRRLLSSDDSETEEFESRSMCRSSKRAHTVVSNISDSIGTVRNENSLVTSKRPTAEELKQERLRKQREKQAEFRKQIEDKRDITTNKLTKIKEKPEVRKSVLGSGSKDFRLMSKNQEYSSELLSCSPIRNSKYSEKSVIFVDSKEISGSQDIISDLRFKHSIVVSAAQLSGCDYIVSNRMAVERKQWSEFSNGANRAKLIERMQHLGDLYDRPCLIVEKDRVKPGEEKSTKPIHWTKYVDRTVALLLRSSIKVLHTDNFAESAQVLADLCKLEQRKNMGINVPVELNEERQSRLKFYISMPKLNYIHALNLCDGFKSVSEFLKASVSLIEKYGRMSRNRAIEVYNYNNRNFDSNMLPSSYM